MAGEDKELGAEIFKVVGPRIAERREAIGLSQEVLADQAKLHRTAISPLELGKRGTRLVTVFRIAAALRMTPAELLDGIYWNPDEDGENFIDEPPPVDDP